MSIAPIVMGIVMMVLGMIGKPSALYEPVNTATLVYLFGVLLLMLGLMK